MPGGTTISGYADLIRPAEFVSSIVISQSGLHDTRLAYYCDGATLDTGNDINGRWLINQEVYQTSDLPKCTMLVCPALPERSVLSCRASGSGSASCTYALEMGDVGDYAGVLGALGVKGGSVEAVSLEETVSPDGSLAKATQRYRLSYGGAPHNFTLTVTFCAPGTKVIVTRPSEFS